MIRIIRDGEVLKETEDIQTLVQYIDFYDAETKYLEIRPDYDKIEERNRRNAAELGN
tara:strand:+ start:2055 stop:2225 length:171 start_codon:yes stop_codon:yes gene_type:complete